LGSRGSHVGPTSEPSDPSAGAGSLPAQYCTTSWWAAPAGAAAGAAAGLREQAHERANIVAIARRLRGRLGVIGKTSAMSGEKGLGDAWMVVRRAAVDALGALEKMAARVGGENLDR